MIECAFSVPTHCCLKLLENEFLPERVSGKDTNTFDFDWLVDFVHICIRPKMSESDDRSVNFNCRKF